MARKAKQGHFEGMEPPVILEIDQQAEEYVTFRDERMRLLKLEIEAQDKLLDLMKKNKLKTYQFDGADVIIVPGQEKVKVKRKKEASDEDEEEDD